MPQKSEIFLFLAERRSDLAAAAGDGNTAAVGVAVDDSPAQNVFAALSEQLPAAESEKFELLRKEFQNKSDEEKREWRERIANQIGSDERLIDDNIHWSHIRHAIEGETVAIQKILFNSLSEAHRELFLQENFGSENPVGNANRRVVAGGALEKNIRFAFAKRFVGLRDLPGFMNFDRLDGAQMARLIRLAGIREVALACAGIEAVETVAAFLRRFAPDDARAIAAQLSGLRGVNTERLLFAENLVHQGLELEPDPSAMLDWLGFRLVGILLCRAAPARAVYAEQKLPLGVTPRLSEIVETQCRQTSPEWQEAIGLEIENLAAAIVETGERGKWNE